MANVFRGSLFVTKREQPPVLAVTAWVGQALLLTTLAVVSMPPGEAQCASAPSLLRINPDTTRGIPKTLQREVNLPVGDTPIWDPLPYRTPRINLNTSTSSSIVLQAVIPPKPTFNAPPFAPTKFWWQPPDTSKGIAKVLLPELTLPIGDQVYVGPQKVWFQPANTSAAYPLTLIPTPMPVGEQVYVSPARYFFQPADTSTAAYQTTHPFVAVPLPPGDQLLLGPQKYRFQSPDMSASAYAAQKFVQQPNPPGKIAFVGAPRHVWQVQNTSTWAYPTLYPPPIVPPSGSSGTACIKITRDSMIASSLRLLRVLQDGQSPTADMITLGSEDLNMLIASFQAKGLQLWTYQWLEIPLQQGKNTYTIGPSGADVTSVRPLRMFQDGCYLHSSSGFDRPLIVLSRTDYASMTEKGEQGVANSIYYQPSIDSGLTTSPSLGHGTLYVLWNPSDSTSTIVANVQRPIYQMVNGTDEFDFPCEWFLAIRYGLAVVMADQYEVPQSRLIRLAKQAAQYHKKLQDWSVEEAGFRFAPEQMNNGWGDWV